MQNRRNFFKNITAALGLVSFPSISIGRNAENTLKEVPTREFSDPFEQARSQLLVPKERIYLNTGSLGPSPQPVVNAVIEAMQKLEANPVVENWGELGKEMESVRSKIGKFINAKPEDIILTRNTTEGLCLIGQSLKLNQGDEILTTTREHGGGEVGFEFLAKRDRATFRKIELPKSAESPEQIVEVISKAITPKTKVLLLSHVNTITGMRMPFRELSILARDKNFWLIADGAQAPGLIDVDVQTLGVDAYSSSGHKWMQGPKETGFLYMSKALQEFVKPVFTSKGYNSYSASSGTRNVAQFIGLGSAIDWHMKMGTKAIEARCMELREYCEKGLLEIKGLTIISPTHTDLKTGIVSVELKKSVNTEVAEALRGKDIIVKVLPGHNALRFSCHLFVSKKDIDTMIKELKTLVL